MKRHFGRLMSVAAVLLLASTAAAPVAATAAGVLGGNGAYSPVTVSDRVVRHAGTGLVRFLAGTTRKPVSRASADTARLSYADAARAFLTSQQDSFGLTDAARQMAVVSEQSAFGRAVVKFQQSIGGVAVLGGQLNVQLDRTRNVISASGETLATPDLSLVPTVKLGAAGVIAKNATAAAHHLAAAGLLTSRPSLAIHDPRIFGGPAAPTRLVWRVEVTSRDALDVDEIVLIDAHTGRVAVQFNQTMEAAPPADATQRICDANNTANRYPCLAGQRIANPATSTIADVKNAFKFAEQTYDFYAHRFGRNSLDNAGEMLVSTTRFCPSTCPYANAFFSSTTQQMVYGKGYAKADDVVAHELTHGVTAHESNLAYYYQSGAINESISDIMGEFFDQTNGSDGAGGSAKWLIGEDLGIVYRDMADPTTHNQPDTMTSDLWTGDFSFTDQGGVHTNSGVGNKAAYLMTQPGSHSFNGQTMSGIGIDKAAAIWYRVDATLLTSASDYGDLYLALQQACADLIGTTPKNASGAPSASAITSANCVQVKAAADAVEMNQPAREWPIPAEASVCTAGQHAVNKLLEKFSNSNSATWKFQPTDGVHWFFESTYAPGTNAIGAGNDTSGPAAFDTRLEQQAALTLPAHAFLRFQQFHNLFPNEAGGVVEYMIGTGAWKRVPSSMFVDYPYNGTIDSASPATVLSGKPAFTGFSGGWTSSRLNLSSLSGKSVRFRFRLVTDANGAGDSWIVDNIQIYTCAAN